MIGSLKTHMRSNLQWSYLQSGNYCRTVQNHTDLHDFFQKKAVEQLADRNQNLECEKRKSYCKTLLQKFEESVD